MTNAVILEDGRSIALSKLPTQVPSLCFQGDLHLSVCYRMAMMRGSGTEPNPIFLNYLFVKSDRARQLTAMIALIKAGRIAVREVRSSWIDRDWSDLLGETATILCKGRSAERVSCRQLLRFAIKCFCSRIFRIIGGKKSADDVVRAWVDTTDAVLADAVARSHLLIYPFAGNVMRQVRYIRRCRRLNRSFSLCGVAYGWFDVVRVILAKRESQVDRYCSLEARAYAAHARELINSGVRHVYATDEYEIGAPALHGALMERNVTSYNATHGIAVYGPCVRYSHCRFHSDHQLQHYRKHGQFCTYDFHDIHDLLHDSKENPRIDAGAKTPIAVYVLGNWRASRKVYESKLEQRAIDALRRACGSLSIELMLKAHPNLRRSQRFLISKRYGAKVLTKWNQLSGTRPVFVNLLSTAYYDLVKTGPCLFVADELIDPSIIFGDHVDCINVDRMKSEIEPFVTSDYWRQRLRRQIQDESARFKALRENASKFEFG